MCCVQEACQAFFAAHEIVVALNEMSAEADPCAVSMALYRRDAALRLVRRQTARTGHAVRAKLRVLHALKEWLGVEGDVVGEFAIEMTEEMATFFADDSVEEHVDDVLYSKISDEQT